MCNTRLRIFSNCANNCVQLRRSGKKRGPGRILNIFHTYVKLCPRCAPRILHMISSSCRQSHLTPHVDLPKICAKRAAHIFAYFHGARIFSHIFANIRKYSQIWNTYSTYFRIAVICKNVRYIFSHISVTEMCKKYVSGGAFAKISKSSSCCSQLLRV